MSPEEVIAPGSPYWDFMAKAYKLGYHKLPFPEVFGGPGLSPFQISLIMEELAWGSFGLTLALNTTLDAAVAMGGTAAAHRRVHHPVLRAAPTAAWWGAGRSPSPTTARTR